MPKAYAVINEWGQLYIDSVGATKCKAMINWLCTEGGVKVFQLTSDEQIVEWFQKKSVELGVKLVNVSILAKDAVSSDLTET